MGKALVLNTLVGSLLIYKMSVLLNIDNHLLNKFDAIVHKFLWKGQRGKNNLQILRNPVELGGLTVDFSVKQKY